MADAGDAASPTNPPQGPNLRQRYPQPGEPATTTPPQPPQPPQPQRIRRNQPSARERAVAGAVRLGIVTAVVSWTYLLADNDALFPVAVATCVATFSTVLLNFAFGGNNGVGNGRPRVRHIRHHRHFTGERAAYVRTSQRLAMMDRDFTDADYEMLLDLDNNSQRLRRFLEGASHETVSRLPTFVYRNSMKRAQENSDKEASDVAAGTSHSPSADADAGGTEMAMEPLDDAEADDLKKEKTEGAANRNGSAKLLDITANDSEFAGDTARKCTICLEDFEDGMKIRILPCFHRFMADCIDPWLAQQARCPVCKFNIQEVMNSMPPGMS